jgi:hypothetical protein
MAVGAYTVLLSTGEPETGLWCVECLLPSRVRIPVVMITEAGASDTAVPAVDVCTSCGRRHSPARPAS